MAAASVTGPAEVIARLLTEITPFVGSCVIPPAPAFRISVPKYGLVGVAVLVMAASMMMPPAALIVSVAAEIQVIGAPASTVMLPKPLDPRVLGGKDHSGTVVQRPIDDIGCDGRPRDQLG